MSYENRFGRSVAHESLCKGNASPAGSRLTRVAVRIPLVRRTTCSTSDAGRDAHRFCHSSLSCNTARWRIFPATRSRRNLATASVRWIEPRTYSRDQHRKCSLSTCTCGSLRPLSIRPWVMLGRPWGPYCCLLRFDLCCFWMVFFLDTDLVTVGDVPNCIGRDVRARPWRRLPVFN